MSESFHVHAMQYALMILGAVIVAQGYIIRRHERTMRTMAKEGQQLALRAAHELSELVMLQMAARRVHRAFLGEDRDATPEEQEFALRSLAERLPPEGVLYAVPLELLGIEAPPRAGPAPSPRTPERN